MGTDISCVLGRINTRTLTDESQPPEVSSGGALALFNNRRIGFGDLVLESWYDKSDEYDLGRNYDLFGWLAGVRRPGIKPLANLEKLREQTHELLAWILAQYKALPHHAGRSSMYDYEWELKKATGIDVENHSHVFYPVPVLTAFDYNEVALVEVPGQDEDAVDKMYMRHPEGNTYLDEFGGSWETFLKALVRDDWHFVIFSFD